MIDLTVAVFALAALLPAELPPPGVIPLPPLVIDGQSARVHTQGLEIVDKYYYVTARREDVVPKRALLLRTEGTYWQVWDITPKASGGSASLLDHPGGMLAECSPTAKTFGFPWRRVSAMDEAASG